MSDFVWLASYPKSGNTWFRVFLSNFLRDQDAPADINALEIEDAASNRSLIDSAMAVECSELTEEELAWYRPQAFRELARRSKKTSYAKVHDAWTCSAEGEALFPPDISRGAIYLVRNPLAVAVSFAHHSGVSLDEMIDRMNRPDFALTGNPRRAELAVKQYMSTWSIHVLSWLDQTAIPVHLVRYEDMLDRPLETFRNAVRFLGLHDDQERIRKAVAFSSFGELKAQEQTHGFRERPSASNQFFRQGRADAWRETLTEGQVERVTRDHRAVMMRMGYLG